MIGSFSKTDLRILMRKPVDSVTGEFLTLLIDSKIEEGRALPVDLLVFGVFAFI
jgi:hypothetical protein